MKILCYGDSNTWGHNPLNGTRLANRWTKVLQSLFDKKTEVIEEGLCGRTATFMDNVKPYRHGLSMLKGILETHQPVDVVIIMLGTNDLKSCFSPDAVAISNGIKEMIHIIKNPFTYNANVSIPKVLIISPILIKNNFENIERTKEQFGERAVVVSQKLSTYYKSLADQYSCGFIDASKYAEASDIDCIHMDEENHKKLAKIIYETIRAW